MHEDLKNLNEEVFLYKLNVGNPCRTRNKTDTLNVQYNSRPEGRGSFSTQQIFGNLQQNSE